MLAEAFLQKKPQSGFKGAINRLIRNEKLSRTRFTAYNNKCHRQLSRRIRARNELTLII